MKIKDNDGKEWDIDFKLPRKFELELEQVYSDWFEVVKNIQKNEERVKKLKRIIKKIN